MSVSDSRGRGLELGCDKIVRPGLGMGGMREVIRGIVAGPVGVDLFVVWGGICDLSHKGKGGKIRREEGGVEKAVREMRGLDRDCARAGVNVMFTTIPPVNFALCNNGVASSTPAQRKHEQEVKMFNDQVVRINIANCFSTPLAHTVVMRKKKQRHCFLWNNLLDGVHIIPYQTKKVSVMMLNAVKKNVAKMNEMKVVNDRMIVVNGMSERNGVVGGENGVMVHMQGINEVQKGVNVCEQVVNEGENDRMIVVNGTSERNGVVGGENGVMVHMQGINEVQKGVNVCEKVVNDSDEYGITDDEEWILVMNRKQKRRHNRFVASVKNT